MELPSVSVVIPVRDDSSRLDLCLSALEASTYKGPLEVLVVDNGSLEDIWPVVSRRHNVRLIKHPTGGSYAARNAGVAGARGEVLAFTDSDCVPEPTWIDGGVARILREAGVAAVAGGIEVFPEHSDAPTLIELYEMMTAFPQWTYVEQHSFGVTANLFVTAEALTAVGGFDSTVMSGGDNDFGKRLKNDGFKIVYEPGARVRHPARRTVRALFEKRVRVMKGVLVSQHARGHPAQVSFAEHVRRWLPPRYAIRRAVSDGRLQSCRLKLKFVAAATLVRYVDAVAWIVAERAARRESAE